MQVFLTSVKWWSFTVTANFLVCRTLLSILPDICNVVVLMVIIIIIVYSFRVFHISVSWWFLTGVWVTASLLKSPGLVSGFWPFFFFLFLLLHSLGVFDTSFNWWFFHWTLSDSQSHLVSKTFLNILSDLNNAVVCKVLVPRLISNSSRLFSMSLRDYSKCTNCNSCHCYLHLLQIFQFFGKILVFVHLCVFFYFNLVVHWIINLIIITISTSVP